MIEEKTKLFIKRERIRRELIKTKPGETICLQDWEIQIILDWIKELESKVNKNAEREKKYCKGTVKGYGRW